MPTHTEKIADLFSGQELDDAKVLQLANLVQSEIKREDTIQQIIDLKKALRQQFDPEKLVHLYCLIGMLE